MLTHISQIYSQYGIYPFLGLAFLFFMIYLGVFGGKKNQGGSNQNYSQPQQQQAPQQQAPSSSTSEEGGMPNFEDLLK